MQTRLIFDPTLSADELRGFARTVAEIEWLLLILVMLYQVVLDPDPETTNKLLLAMFVFAAFVLAFHYFNFYRRETLWKIALETWVMIAFITWVLAYTGGAESPLYGLYILVIIVSALTLGKLATLLEIALIAMCYVWLSYPQALERVLSLQYGTRLLAQLAPMLLVAYVTTMLSADIRRAYSRMKTLSETDELTGVLNMRGFTTLADRVFRQAERYGHPFSILMIDSDSLKAVNDDHGHETGNRLLRLTVECVMGQLRQSDVLARYGGDEFVALLPETRCSAAVGVADRIRRSVEAASLSVRGRTISASVSVGVACYPDHGANYESVLEKADRALYSSKTEGKNRTTLYLA